MFTKREREEIKRHYFYMELRFRKDGTVEARKSNNGAWGILYTAGEARRHLEAVKARRGAA